MDSHAHEWVGGAGLVNASDACKPTSVRSVFAPAHMVARRVASGKVSGQSGLESQSLARLGPETGVHVWPAPSS